MYHKWLKTYSSKEYQKICDEVANMFDNAILLRLDKNYKDSVKGQFY